MEAIRGNVYEVFNRRTQESRFALVISGNHRAQEEIISAIFLDHNFRGRTGKRNVEEIKIFDSERLYVHCDRISYFHRDELMENVYTVPEEKMKKIDIKICQELGLLEDQLALLKYYKTEYLKLESMLSVEPDLYEEIL